MVRRKPIVLALHDLQRAMYRSLVEGEDGDVAAHVLSDGIAAANRLTIYRNTFYGTLTNALRLSYPAVHRLVGAEFFEGAAHAFINAHPPRGAYLDEYGSNFADFLACFPTATSVPYLADVARLEWAVTRALHAADATPLDLMKLHSVDGDSRPRCAADGGWRRRSISRRTSTSRDCWPSTSRRVDSSSSASPARITRRSRRRVFDECA
jgi:hypothetical protein